MREDFDMKIKTYTSRDCPFYGGFEGFFHIHRCDHEDIYQGTCSSAECRSDLADCRLNPNYQHAKTEGVS